jgi:flavoprotein
MENLYSKEINMIYIKEHKIIDEIEKKWCHKCKTWLELDCFHNHTLTYDFLTIKCKGCSVKRGRPDGYVMSDKSKQKVSDSLKGRTFSILHRENLSKSTMGNKNGLHKKRVY